MAIATFFGLVHLLSYFLAKIGNIHQLVKIWKYQKINQKGTGKNTAQISLFYRANIALFFLFNIFWAVSLPQIDWTIVFTRFLSLILALDILLELWHDRNDEKTKYSLIFCLVLALINTYLIVFNFPNFQTLNDFFGIAIITFSFSSVAGYLDKAYQIIKAQSPGKQSLLELIFQFNKDLTGIVYGLFLGFSQGWPLIISLLLLAAVRILNIGIYLYYDRKNQATLAKV